MSPLRGSGALTGAERSDPYLAALAEKLDFFAPGTWQHRYYAALREKYERERDFGWGPDVAWARAEAMTTHYLGDTQDT